MGIITDLFFAIGNICKWTFEHLLSPIGIIFGWVFTFVLVGMLAWWLKKLASFGNDPEKKYDEI